MSEPFDLRLMTDEEIALLPSALQFGAQQRAADGMTSYEEAWELSGGYLANVSHGKPGCGQQLFSDQCLGGEADGILLRAELERRNAAQDAAERGRE